MIFKLPPQVGLHGGILPWTRRDRRTDFGVSSEDAFELSVLLRSAANRRE